MAVGEGEREEFSTTGGGELAEEACGGASWKPGDATGPDGMALEAGIDHGQLKSMGGVGSFGASEGVVGAGKEKGAGLEASEAGVGDLVRDGLPLGVGKMVGKRLGDDVGLQAAEGSRDSEIRAMCEVGGLDAVVVYEQNRSDAEQAEETCGFGAESTTADDGHSEVGNGMASVGSQLQAAVINRIVGVRHLRRGGIIARTWWICGDTRYR